MEILDQEFYLKKEILKKNNFELAGDFKGLTDFEKYEIITDLFDNYINKLDLNLDYDYDVWRIDDDMPIIIIKYSVDEYDGHGDYEHYIYKYLIDFEKNKILKTIKN